jgi:hypothetical protein
MRLSGLLVRMMAKLASSLEMLRNQMLSRSPILMPSRFGHIFSYSFLELILMDARNLTLYLDSPIDAGSVPGSISELKLVALGNGTTAMVYSGTAPNGTLYNPGLAETLISTGRMYTKVFVRYWDTCKSASCSHSCSSF